jgi:hypothetical protein
MSKTPDNWWILPPADTFKLTDYILIDLYDAAAAQELIKSYLGIRPMERCRNSLEIGS